MPKVKTLDARLEVRLPRDTTRAAQQKARKAGKPLAQIVRELIAAWLGQ